jgi:hypothetical protein
MLTAARGYELAKAGQHVSTDLVNGRHGQQLGKVEQVRRRQRLQSDVQGGYARMRAQNSRNLLYDGGRRCGARGHLGQRQQLFQRLSHYWR